MKAYSNNVTVILQKIDGVRKGIKNSILFVPACEPYSEPRLIIAFTIQVNRVERGLIQI